MADAATKMINWDFYAKRVFIGIAVRVLFLIRPRGVWTIDRNESGKRSGKTLALILLTCWAGAITTGRLTAYLG